MIMQINIYMFYNNSNDYFDNNNSNDDDFHDLDQSYLRNEPPGDESWSEFFKEEDIRIHNAIMNSGDNTDIFSLLGEAFENNQAFRDKYLQMIRDYDTARPSLVQEYVAKFYHADVDEHRACSWCNTIATFRCETCRHLGMGHVLCIETCPRPLPQLLA
jgi:hypothetical protein